MRLQFGTLAFVAAVGLGSSASAQVDTPPNCHWVALPDAPATIEMWCRADDGRARPTGRKMQQGPASASDGCPKGKIYDGQRCVTEAAALAAAPQGYIGPERPPTPQPAAKPAPRVLMFQDRNGRNRRGMACIDRQDVTVCQPIPRY